TLIPYTTLFRSRKRRLPDARKRGYEQFRAMRQATNAIIQGSAAIHTKLTLLEVQKLCRRKGWTLAFSVHDEIGLYCPEDITSEDAKEFEKVMTDTVQISVLNKADDARGRRCRSSFMTKSDFMGRRILRRRMRKSSKRL